MKAIHSRAMLILATIIASWLGMQAVHELGHVIGARLTEAEVRDVNLHPLSISETRLGHDPQPLIVVWAGPILGSLLPLLFWGVAIAATLPEQFVLRFFAGFCLIANGVYIGLGSFGAMGDCHGMLTHGSPMWQLWLFGLVTAPLGIWLWDGQAKHFGLGPQAEVVPQRVIWTTAVTAGALIVSGLSV